MKTTRIDEHGQTVTLIGTIGDMMGNRFPVEVVEFGAKGDRTFSVRATGRPLNGISDAARFSTQVRRCKAVYEDPTNQAEWYV